MHIYKASENTKLLKVVVLAGYITLHAFTLGSKNFADVPYVFILDVCSMETIVQTVFRLS